MKNWLFALLSVALLNPHAAQAYARADALLPLLRIDSYLTDDWEYAASDVELDEAGQASLVELQKLARENPEAFAAMLSEDPLETSDDPSLYCTDPNDMAYLWKAKRPRKATPKCTQDILKRKSPTTGCCLLYVRSRLGLPQGSSVSASNYGPVLQRHGYCNRIKQHTAQNAPKGAVLVYSGGSNGHIELKTGPSSYYFGPTNSSPATTWTTQKRRLTGIWVKCK